MRRILALISIILALGAFTLLCLIWELKIDVSIPIFMFIIAFMLLIAVKRMKSDEAGKDDVKSGEAAFYNGARVNKNSEICGEAPENGKKTSGEGEKTSESGE